MNMIIQLLSSIIKDKQEVLNVMMASNALKLGAVLWLLVTLLSNVARAEEQSKMGSMASMSTTAMLAASYSVDGLYATQTGQANYPHPFLTINLGSEITVHTVFILQDSWEGIWQLGLGHSHIYVNNNSNPTSTGSPDKQNVHASGFHQLDAPATGQYLGILRHESWGNSDIWFNEIRFYQVPNILSWGPSQVLPITTPSEDESRYSADNLINNLDSRGPNWYTYPYINAYQTSPDNSCFRASASQLDAGRYVLGIDHLESYFQHAIMLLEDLDGPYGQQSYYDRFHDYDIYIGDSADYTQNTACAGNPQMTSSSGYVGADWRHGQEAWCNLEGRYTHIVREYASTLYASSLSICSFGVMGTRYIRDTAIVTFEVVALGGSTVFNLDDIKSEFTIGNTLAPKMRQASGSTLNFVSLQDETGYTQVTLDATDSTTLSPYSPGIHTLNLQSFDDADDVQSTLKADSLTIYVTEFKRDTPIIADMVITRGDSASFDVEYIYSEMEVYFGTLAINLRQPSGAKLDWVDLFEVPGSSLTRIDIDTSDIAQIPDSQEFTLTLYSFDTSGTLPSDRDLREDTVILYVTDYIRNEDLVQTITMRQDSTRMYSVPHCFAELASVPASYAISANLRQQPGTELPWVTITETTGQSDVFLDPTLEPVGIYILWLESYDTNDPEPDPLLKPTLRTDMIQIEVTNYIRNDPIESPVTITLGDTLTIEVPHAFEESSITTLLDINMRQPLQPSDLSWVQINDDEPDHTIITIDTSAQLDGYYTVDLWSYSTIAPAATVLTDDILREDVITIEIPSYFHSIPLAEAVTVRKDEYLVIIIPNCVPTIPITPVQNIDLRQQPGTELSFVSFTEYNGSTHVHIDATALEAWSTHELVIESFDSLSLLELQSTLRVDVIEILIEPKACDITQEQVDAFGLAHATDYAQLIAQLGIGWETVLYHELYDEAFYEVFGLDDPDRESCGSLEVELVSPYPFLADYPTLKTFVLAPQWEDTEGIYTEAYQKFTVNGKSTSLPISAFVWNCDLISVGFKKISLQVEYEIGSGPLEKPLPAVEQKPECNIPFTDFSIVSTSASSDAAPAAVVFENASFTIDSSDYTLDTHTLRFVVAIDTSIIATESFIFDITFTKPPPQFNQAGLTVSPITCSQKDATWSLELPPMVNPSIQVVTVSMTTVTSVFSFNASTNTVTIAGAVKSALLSGQYCPEEDINLDFLISSDKLGTATETITIPVTGEASGGSASSFIGYVVGDETSQSQTQRQEEVKIQELLVEKMTVSQTGLLVIRFNRSILIPKIKIDGGAEPDLAAEDAENAEQDTDDSDASRLLRLLAADEVEHSIEEVLAVWVADDDPDDDLDKGVQKLALNVLSERQMEVQITFNDHEAISSDISERDYLAVKFLLPRLFIDAETGEPLDKASHNSEVDLKQQLSESELDSLKEMAQTAATVGLFATVFEIALCFVLGKALEAMWTLIYATQFLVYIGMWNINYPRKLQFFFDELKRIALGEFVDDLGLEPRILALLNVDEGWEDENEVGYERFGSPDLFNSLGVTFYFTLGLFALVLATALLIIFCGRRCDLSEKNAKRLQNLEDQLFYNPVIRLTFLSALKANLTPILVFKLLSDDPKQMYSGCVILLIANVLPLHYAWVLSKHRKVLDTDLKTRTIGSLYDTRNVRRDYDGRVWTYPITFFYRRLCFAIITIFLFDRPDMQMIVHQFMSMMIVVYISWDNRMFKDRQTRFVEIATEAFLFTSCLFIQVMILPLDEVQIEDVKIMIFVSVGLLITVNIVFVFYKVYENCKDKKRTKRRAARRATWEAAWKEVEKKKPSRFRKPRQYDRERVRGGGIEGGEKDRRKAGLVSLQSLVQGPLPAIREEDSGQGQSASQSKSDQGSLAELSGRNLPSGSQPIDPATTAVTATKPAETTGGPIGLVRPRPDFLKQLNEMHTRVQHHIEQDVELDIRQDAHVYDIFSENGTDVRSTNTRATAKQKRIGEMRKATSTLFDASAGPKLVEGRGGDLAPRSKRKPVMRVASEYTPQLVKSDQPMSPDAKTAPYHFNSDQRSPEMVAPPEQKSFYSAAAHETASPVVKPNRNLEFRNDPKAAFETFVKTQNVQQRPVNQQPNLHRTSTTKNAGNMLALPHSRNTQMSTTSKVREDLDDLLQEIDSCYSQVARSEAKKDAKLAEQRQQNRDRKEETGHGGQAQWRANNYVDESQDIEDFISEIDTYLHSTKK